jgi:hypothetical protein
VHAHGLQAILRNYQFLLQGFDHPTAGQHVGRPNDVPNEVNPIAGWHDWPGAHVQLEPVTQLTFHALDGEPATGDATTFLLCAAW